jgi:hypothetical protein
MSRVNEDKKQAAPDGDSGGHNGGERQRHHSEKE